MSENLQNPDLPVAGALDTNKVAALPSFPGGTPAPVVVVEPVEKHYVAAIPSASMHTTDGTRITFINGFFSTKLKHVKEYLDKELEGNNIYIRAATPSEVDTIKMTRDPKGTMRAALIEEMGRDEATLRATLEKEILGKLLGVTPSEVQGTVDDYLNKVETVVEGAETVVDAVADKVKSWKGALKGTPAAGAVTQGVSPLNAGMVGTDKIAGAAAGS